MWYNGTTRQLYLKTNPKRKTKNKSKNRTPNKSVKRALARSHTIYENHTIDLAAIITTGYNLQLATPGEFETIPKPSKYSICNKKKSAKCMEYAKEYMGERRITKFFDYINNNNNKNLFDKFRLSVCLNCVHFFFRWKCVFKHQASECCAQLNKMTNTFITAHSWREQRDT